MGGVFEDMVEKKTEALAKLWEVCLRALARLWVVCLRAWWGNRLKPWLSCG